MSGGSYNYLCQADHSDIGNKTEDLQEMIERLKELGFYDIARESQLVLEHVKKTDPMIDKLSEIWKAVEWMDSGDGDLQSVNEEIAKFRSEF